MDHHQIAPVGDQLIEQFAQLQAGHDRFVEQVERLLDLVREDRLRQGDDAVVAGGAEQAVDLIRRQPFAAEGQQLIEQRLGVAHRAAGPPRDQLERLVVGLHAFARDDVAQMLDDARHARCRRSRNAGSATGS